MSRIRRTRRVTVALCAATALGLGATGAAFAQQSGPAGGRPSAQAGGHEYPGAGQGKVTPVPAEFRAGAGERSLTAAAGITRSEVIARAKSWVGKGLDYSWTNYYQGYRMDCSGYVSMAWGLGSSLATPNFVPGGSAEWITKAELKAGDALLDDDSGADGHIVLFEEWATADKTSYWGYEFTPSGVHHRILPYPYYAGKGPFAPVRLKNIVDDTIPEAEEPKEDTSSRINADFNADGRDDVAALYGYGDGSVALFTFLARADGGFDAPLKSWTRPPGNWTFKSVKLTAGDYDGNGRADLAAMYDYADGSVSMFTFKSRADGGFSDPVKSWTTAPGNWWPENVKLASGDFDGNGRDDVGAFYGYSDGRAALYTFKPDASGAFGTPLRSWNVPEDYWWGENVELAVGDFDGNGRADLAAMYGYEDGTVSMFTFKSQTDGGFVAPVKSWTTEPGNWNFSNVKLTAGDYDGDGRADAAAFYGYSDGRAALYTFNTKTDGTFNSPVRSWNVPADNWWGENVQIASGDYDNNGRADVAAFYGYSDGRAALYTFKPDATGKFGSPLRSWNVPADYWWGEHVKLG
ncbi:FG-GAP-like repeat-containing protein [Streptomyces hydrogenans]|uniref:C40 family peptidase n=1 Tax=Streptomyces hydrogenans TaxID=1873719 RepID=UPI0035DC9425